MSTNTQYQSIIGSDYPGMTFFTREPIPVAHSAICFDEHSPTASTSGLVIPARAKGTLVQMEAGQYKLSFSFSNRTGYDTHEVSFWIKRRYIDTLFTRE